MSVKITIQRITQLPSLPSRAQFCRWVNAALSNQQLDYELTIRLVDEKESERLNTQYRHKTNSTNILSFAYQLPVEDNVLFLGDLVICAPLVIREAQMQNKTSDAHWAHLVIHGVLHLLGHDHQKTKEAKVMEALEINIMQQLKFPHPYLVRLE